MDGKPKDTPVEEIPGIGIIRARSLKKAGWPTVESLRKASVADLMAVRGITEIKAAQILDYIHGLSAESPASSNGAAAPAAASAPAAPKSSPTRKAPTTRSTTARVKAPSVPAASVPPPPPETVPVTFTEQPHAAETVPVYAIQSPRDLMQDVALSAQLLLTSEFAGQWERPFAVQLGKLITLHDKWDRFEPLSKKQSKQALELLQKIYRLLTETPVSEITKRKSQERHADLLRDRRRRLRDILEA